MTQEDKNLLLKDLCERVPYHPKGHVVNACNGAECDEWLTCATFTMFTNVTNNCFLYLRPMSSMTDEEKREASSLFGHNKCIDEYGCIYCYNNGESVVDLDNIIHYYDWLNAHHFDYRGLIEKGLAIEVTKENNPYK